MTDDELAALQKRLEDHEQRIAALEVKQTVTQPGSKETSIKEFILSKKPLDDVHRTLTIGYFLEKYEGRSDFTTKELTEAFRSAKEKVPPNVSDKVQINIKKGHMMDSGKKDKTKSYMLTSSGERHVENNFQKED